VWQRVQLLAPAQEEAKHKLRIEVDYDHRFVTHM
jgi:hypothetical protein